MRSARSWVALGSAGLAATASILAVGAPAATAAGGSHHAQAQQKISPALERSKPAGKVSPSSRVSFDLVLKLHHAKQAYAMTHKVSTPGNSHYRHFLSDAKWESRFSPRHAQVAAAKSWLTKHGFRVDSVPATRLFISAHASAGRIEHTFSTQLGYYKVNGATVRLANSKLHLPSALAARASGIVGVSQHLNTPDLSTPADPEPAPPAGFANPQPCSAYYGKKVDHTDSPSLYAPYTPNRPIDICGYSPSQLRSAYKTQSGAAHGIDGSGVTVAIVDAYDSPTLLSDAQHYAALNDPSHPLLSSQFTNDAPSDPVNEDECAGSGWFTEQSLDVEAVHAMAPGAHITFVGGNDCFDDSFLAAEQTAITSGASAVTNSWSQALGDLFEDADGKTAYDNEFVLAADTGVSVMFSTGDDGDNFADFGLDVPNYPATSPLVTAVGGTSLKINGDGNNNGEFGWSTAKQTLCAGVASTNCGSQTTPTGALAFQAGGGGGTSYYYNEPDYQASVVPADLATRNSALFGGTPTRVIPDISMDADAQTGMLIGATQTYPDGVHYGQFKEGGTSLASPLLAGAVADADQAAGGSVGFLNPVLYAAAGDPSVIRDIGKTPTPLNQATIRVDYANTVDATDGYNVSLRVLDYEGPETFCDGTGNCATRDTTLNAYKGFDSMTGLGSIGTGFVSGLAAFADTGSS